MTTQEIIADLEDYKDAPYIHDALRDEVIDMSIKGVSALNGITALIEEYQNAIELLEEDRRTEKLTISNAYRTAKIGVYAKVVDDLKMLLEEGE